MTVAQIQAIRKEIRKQGGSMKIAKNTLLTIAASDYPHLEQLQPYFKNQIAIIFSKEESPEIAQAISKTSEENAKFKVLVGCLGNMIISTDKIKAFGNIGSRELVLARLAGVIKAPLVKIAWLLQEVSKNKQ